MKHGPLLQQVHINIILGGKMQTKEKTVLIEHMLSEVEAQFSEERLPDFIFSLRDQFERRGTLSLKQVEALKTWYERATA